ncbi:Uu.00g098790.m01.CDS01 [Anthostomella pinea]|uniref:Uu.00g098790.m01.CDS01 n=1 Tax=Anthostomella pinea TaxID=933095 RepID=A0AAI8YF56_9PEZI|nr:Uu.00g098790.m01.CDS01 [Anthostomella pinea]
MGVDSRKPPPLPAPTETESLSTPTELAPSGVSKPGDENSHYSLPDDGTPVTIRTRGHRQNKSQTSLLIEYFEGGKPRSGSPGASGATERKPSVRVRLTPSKGRGKNDHIQITETKSRKASLTRRATASPNISRSELDMIDPEDARSMNSYASATEESNVSRNPIEVEIDSSHPRRRRKATSPLIPAVDSKTSTYQPPNMSDISAIPTDSFLDGSGGTTTAREEKRARSPLRGDGLAAGALGAVAAAAAADKLNRKNRSESHERSVIQKAVEKASKPERKHRSKSRTSSVSEKDGDSRRRSKGSHKESLVSAVDSSLLSSQLTGSHRSYDSHSSSKISINNPKLLETVEDAIRRLILPELDALKRENSQRETKRTKHRDSLSSLTSGSREETSVTSKRKSADTTHSTKSKDRRDREARNDLSPHSSIDHISIAEDVHDDETTPRRTRDRLTDAALGAAVVGAALRSRSRGDEKRQRRRRRTETPKRDHTDRYNDEYEESEHEVAPPMPLSSEINPSEMTRTSILSAETDRPHSASEEMTPIPIREVTRGVASMESMSSSPTPTKSPGRTLQSLGTQHANISHGDLRALPRQSTSDFREDRETEEFGHVYPAQNREEYDDDYEEAGHLSEPGMYDEDTGMGHAFYGTQDVPAPLRYVPYQQERRGLSPIQSVSGYTEGESEVQGHRDSRTTHTASERSSPEKLSRHERDLESPGSVPSNMRSREFGDEGSSVRSSGLGYRNTTYIDDSELDGVTSGQAVQVVGGNPRMVHQNFGPESAVASLVDGSVLDPSVLSGSAGPSRQDYRSSQLSYEEAASESSSRDSSPAKRSVDSRQQVLAEQGHSPAPSRERDGSPASREFAEYELNEHGQKVPRSAYRQSPTTSETAITAAALSRAAAAALKRQHRGHESPSDEMYGSQFSGAGVSRNRSFKERAAKDGYQPNATPRHSVDRLSDYSQPRLGASGLPDVDNPMPEIGYGYGDDHRSQQNTPSIVREPLGGSHHESREHWPSEPTPTQEAHDYDRAVTPKASSARGNGDGLGIADAAAVATIATIATAGALAASHSRQPSQEQDDEWQRTSGERKRDTWVTNPYEGTSPIANLPGLEGNILGGTGFGSDQYRNGFHNGSPGLPGGDEGYISAAPNEARDGINGKGKNIEVLNQPRLGDVEDPFYAPKDSRGLSGMSQGMQTPLYDPASGTGIDRIQSKDIIALMEHLMVRDAQRSARDTEILVTLVRSAAEMRNSFEDIKKMLADSEDQIIGEVKDNTEKTVKRHLGGPRPFPGSSGRSVQGGSLAGTDDLPTKKRNLLRRALQGLGAKGANDLGRIEDMLFQLLTDVDVLKHQTAGPGGVSTQAQSLENLQPSIQYEQDRGYEPEGNAGTSTASHASQSGHLSLPQSRGNSTRLGNDRKFSDHRISTVPEDSDEYDDHAVPAIKRYPAEETLLSPASDRQRGGSVPLGTPPHQTPQAQHYSVSNDNTPRTEEGKKHKSRGSTSFFPKISRWSETTASSIGKAFRGSGGSRKQDPPEEYLQHPPSRSGSDLGDYDHLHNQDTYGDDELHAGFSQDLLPPGMDGGAHGPSMANEQLSVPGTYATPEDPKYRAHRNSLNLQHPQPRPGQTERFRTALETSAADYDSPMSPRSADWAGSATSLHRFPAQNTQRYSDNSALNSGAAGDEYNWSNGQSPGQQGPPRPPKEPLDGRSPAQASTPPQNARVNKLQKKQQSPLPYHSVESGYGTASATHAGSYNSGSPRLENRNLSGALGVPTRRPSGPRAMTPTRSDDGEKDERRRKRDTFGTAASPSSAASQESETF